MSEQVAPNWSPYQKLVVDELDRRGWKHKCAMCGDERFSIMNSVHQLVIQQSAVGIAISGRTIPVGVIICNNCGNVYQIALGAIGILKQVEALGEWQ